MKSTHFPLLRSSPAVGTGSYGALPSPGAGDTSSYAASLLSASTTESDEEEEEERESGEYNGASARDDDGGLAPPNIRARRNRKAMGMGVPVPDNTRVRDDRREALGADPFVGRAPALETEYEDEGDEEEDEDDNSP